MEPTRAAPAGRGTAGAIPSRVPLPSPWRPPSLRTLAFTVLWVSLALPLLVLALIAAAGSAALSLLWRGLRGPDPGSPFS